MCRHGEKERLPWPGMASEHEGPRLGAWLPAIEARAGTITMRGTGEVAITMGE